MPTIAFASPKGGAGKTTSSFILACELAERDMKVSIIDADPNHPIAAWGSAGGKVNNLTIIANESEEDLEKDILEAQSKSDFVIVDLEGTANLSTLYSVAFADLVIVPSQRSTLDVGEAAKAVQVVKKVSRIAKRDIPVAILLTRTSKAIRSKGYRRMSESMKKTGLYCFVEEMYEREAFKAIFDHRKSLSQLKVSDVGGLENARINAANLAKEVIVKLKQVKETEKQSKKELESA